MGNNKKPDWLKKSDLKTDTTYLLCPDKSCELFLDPTRRCPCEEECPHQDELIKIIACINCNEPVELPGDHFAFARVDHLCPNGDTACNFQRMRGKYHRLFERPE